MNFHHTNSQADIIYRFSYFFVWAEFAVRNFKDVKLKANLFAEHVEKIDTQTGAALVASDVRRRVYLTAAVDTQQASRTCTCSFCCPRL